MTDSICDIIDRKVKYSLPCLSMFLKSKTFVNMYLSNIGKFDHIFWKKINNGLGETRQIYQHS